MVALGVGPCVTKRMFGKFLFFLFFIFYFYLDEC
jgi:hypothetical protein